MLYNGKRHVKPRNDGRTDLVRRMSQNYEQTAQKQGTNALNASSFEIMLYKIKTHGLKCTCCHDMRKDKILDTEGHMDSELMDTIIAKALQSEPVSLKQPKTRAVIVSATSYNPSSITKSANFDTIQLNEEGNIVDENGDELDAPDPEDYELLEQYDIENGKFDYLAAVTNNCSICSRTGFVGGFNLVNGERRVYDCQSMQDFVSCQIDFTQSPHRIESATEDFVSVRFTDTLPKSIWKVITFRAMFNWDVVSDYELYAVETSGLTHIASNLDLKAFCTGVPVQFELRFKGTLTHVEFLLQSTNKPLFCDITTLNRVASSKRINDLEAITFNLPASVGTIRRGDVFFEKNSRVLWVVTTTEIQRSALNPHGFTGSAERVKSQYEPYSLFNPFLMSAGEVV